MADTIVNTPGVRDRDDSATAVSWIVALIVVLALIVAAFVWFRSGATLPGTTSNINVTVPNTGTDEGTGAGSGNTDTGTGGVTQ